MSQEAPSLQLKAGDVDPVAGGGGSPRERGPSFSLTCPESSLSLAISESLAFVGFVNGQISIYDLDQRAECGRLLGHSRGVFDLVSIGGRLFSASGDGSLRIWDIPSQTCSYVVHTTTDTGDILSLAFSRDRDTVYLGTQSTAIHWIPLDSVTGDHSQSLPRIVSRTELFFRSRGDRNYVEPQDHTDPEGEAHRLPEVPAGPKLARSAHFMSLAHNGYVYGMTCYKASKNLSFASAELLISGSGDGSVKIWSLASERPKEEKRFLSHDLDAVLTVRAVQDTCLCGLQGGDIMVVDLETLQVVRNVAGHMSGVLCIIPIGDAYVASGSADGTVRIWSRYNNFENTEKMQFVDSVTCLASVNRSLYCGGNARQLNAWDLSRILDEQPPPQPIECAINDSMMIALEKFLLIPSVSGDPSRTQDCWCAAKYLRSVLTQLGACATLLANPLGKNPVVYGRFQGKHLGRGSMHVVFYGHYDVQPVRRSMWEFAPFALTSVDEFLYGRGVSDDKGPILAAIFAVSEMLENRELEMDVTFVLEGEEEAGSQGLMETLNANSDTIGHADVVLMSNSNWIGEDFPCLVYGQRGVIHCKIDVSGPMEDLHSGVHGGAVDEPLIDLAKVLARLTDDEGRCMIPNFYGDVKILSAKEEGLLQETVDIASRYPALNVTRRGSQHRQPASSSFPLPAASTESKSSSFDDLYSSRHLDLLSRYQACWQEPSITIHTVSTPTAGNMTVIPRQCYAHISMRIVPDQRVSDIAASFSSYATQVFEQLNTKNHMRVHVLSSAGWWLADPLSKYYQKAANAIEYVWGMRPVLTREGGSIPAIRQLQEHFGCEVVHIPLGQSSDNAHLPNERLRLTNFVKGRKVFREFFRQCQSA